LTASRVVSLVAVAVAACVTAITLATALFTQLHLEPTAEAAFEERVGRPLFAPTFLAVGLCAIAALALLAMLRGGPPSLAFVIPVLSTAAVVVCLISAAEHRRRLDPRPELAKELEALDFGPGAPVVLTRSRPLPDLPEVTWVYRVPLPREQACARARAALAAWADGGLVGDGSSYICGLNARRSGYSVTVGAAPEGAYLTRPSSPNEVGDAPVHYVMVTVSASRSH
jgi:hypothetical protein